MQKPIPYTKKVICFYSVLAIPDLPMLPFSLIQDTHTIWGKLFLKVVSLYYVPFSLVPFGYLHPNRKNVAFGEQIMIIYCNFCFRLIISIDISY